VAHGEDLEPFTVVSSMSERGHRIGLKRLEQAGSSHRANSLRTSNVPCEPVRDRRFLYRQTQHPICKESCEAL